MVRWRLLLSDLVQQAGKIRGLLGKPADIRPASAGGLK
jgi:hypothetical protein